jgi:hypothetical protein
MTSDREFLIDLELLLCTKLRPSFIACSISEEFPDAFEVIISCPQFRNRTIEDRVHMIFNLISYFFEDSIKTRLIIVSALDNIEMDNLLDEIFSKEIM